MRSKLKCPVCNVPLTECGDLLFCPNDHCAWTGNDELWNAFIQATQALEIATKALKDIVFCKQFDSVIAVRKYADKALEQIIQGNYKANSNK